MLKRGDEGELDALALLVARVGRGESAFQPEGLVGVGLEPDQLDHRLPGALALARRRSVVDRQHPLRALRDRVEADVGRDPVEPGAERAPGLESGQAAPCSKQRLLERVVGVVRRAEHPVAVGVELAAVRLDELAERMLVPAAGRLEQPQALRRRAAGAGAHPDEVTGRDEFCGRRQ